MKAGSSRKASAACGSADDADVRLNRNLWQGWKSHQACRDRASRRMYAKVDLTCSCCGYGQRGEGMPRDLLSNHVGFVVCLGFEAAVVGPEVDRIADASDTALVDLHVLAQSDMLLNDRAHHLCCLWPCDRKLHIGISLPETVEQRIPCEEAVVCLPGGGARL